MKNIVRAFVVVLVLTGAAASTRSSSATAKTIAAPVQSSLCRFRCAVRITAARCPAKQMRSLHLACPEKSFRSTR